MLAVVPCRLAAWGGPTHRALTATAVPQVGGAVRGALLDGSVAPDRRGRGWLSPARHGYDPTALDRPNGRPGLAPSTCGQVINAALAKPLDDDGAAFELGRALHVIEDCCVPFHTGRGMAEARYHARYERWVDERADLLVRRAYEQVQREGWAVPVRRPVELAEMLAEWAREDYLALHRLCRRPVWGAELETLTVRRLAAALRGARVLAVDFEARRRPGGLGDGDGMRLPWVWLVCLALHVLVRSESWGWSQAREQGQRRRRGRTESAQSAIASCASPVPQHASTEQIQGQRQHGTQDERQADDGSQFHDYHGIAPSPPLTTRSPLLRRRRLPRRPLQPGRGRRQERPSASSLRNDCCESR